MRVMILLSLHFKKSSNMIGLPVAVTGASLILVLLLLSCAGQKHSSNLKPDIALTLTIFFTGNMTGIIDPCG